MTYYAGGDDLNLSEILHNFIQFIFTDSIMKMAPITTYIKTSYLG